MFIVLDAALECGRLKGCPGDAVVIELATVALGDEVFAVLLLDKSLLS